MAGRVAAEAILAPPLSRSPQTSIMHILLEHSSLWKPAESLNPLQDQFEAQIPPSKPKADHLINFPSVLRKSHRVRVQYLTEAWM